MEDMSWDNPLRRDSLKTDRFQSNGTKDYSQSDSFAMQFTGSRSRSREDAFNEQPVHASFSDLYLGHGQPESIQPESVDHVNGNEFISSQKQILEKEPVFEYTAMDGDNKRSSSTWRFLDLKNKKQTGDLYKKILYHSKKNNSKIFTFVSSREREGVSTIVANLVDYANSQGTDKKILVIDANIKSPGLNRIFNISNNAYGLLDIFDRGVGVHEAIIPISSSIFALCCGQGKRKNYANLEPDNFLKLLNYCRQFFDHIYIDCPPVLSSADSLSVAPAADLTFLVIRSAKVQRPVVEKAKMLLQNDECEIGGVILNRVQQVIPGWVYRFI